MKLSKALRIFGYSVVKLATMPVLLTPLYKYLNWYMGYYLFFILICKLHVYYLRLHFIFFYSNALSCVFIFPFVPHFKLFFLNLFSFSYDNDISLLDILSLADFAGCDQRASLCSNGIGAEMFFVSNNVQF